ncbi:hypothetical protein PACTADRAFT_47968 [Pachysolen tannophilus NRRL Y-2460]|uniref:CDP-diacylglycerol--inositol 3-phosphatidyltransferase n=1 Tax=Pachysolen tannophilus NRRL Y-2460 TaxID=669874 RepID=A0A1E4U2D4_PACTA|nr:hypothetical protein PACTADRAFT_47968 [Pachysolen tannophilus NRRL Y-2460]
MSSKTASTTSAKRITSRDVFYYIPNMIGYSRVLSALLSFFLMRNHPIYTTFIYGISCLLDAFDGFAARKYNQTSRFGAVLDMVTDRCTTSSLICFLAVLYPNYILIWQILVSLDLASHYMHMYASLSTGSKSHKTIGKNQNILLKLYYGDKKVLFIVCAFNEIFFVALYLSHFDFKPLVFGLTFPQILSLISFPLWFFKQFTNIIQLVAASQILSEMDAIDKNKELGL